ncbi:MAG: hypothetical protein LBQ00_03085 [Syntrophobacterales bacterium]|jgi:hypothetical protein|nr:hypothetical protein [Syntrophobacterales bacterium]
MKKSIFLAAAGICFISSCTVFQHPTKTQADLDRDRKECERFVVDNPDPNKTCKYGADSCVTCEAVKRCLEERKGWKRVRN